MNWQQFKDFNRWFDGSVDMLLGQGITCVHGYHSSGFDYSDMLN